MVPRQAQQEIVFYTTKIDIEKQQITNTEKWQRERFEYWLYKNLALYKFHIFGKLKNYVDNEQFVDEIKNMAANNWANTRNRLFSMFRVPRYMEMYKYTLSEYIYTRNV